MKKSTRAAFGDALLELAEEFPNFITLDADLSGSTKTKSFAQKYPDRAFNLGIAEQNMLGFAAGAAITGKIPFACSFAIFSTGRAWEQIRQSVAYANLNVKIIGTHAGILTGEDGATHQSLEDIAVLRSVPNIKIFSPADYYEAKSIVRFTLKDPSPTYLRLGRAGIPTIFDENYKFKEGKAVEIKPGNDFAIFSHGSTASNCLLAAEELEKEGIKVSVFNFSSIKPIDEKAIKKVAREVGRILVVEDHSTIGGLGSAVTEIVSDSCPCLVIRHGMTSFGESGTPADLYQKYALDVPGIVDRAKKFNKK